MGFAVGERGIREGLTKMFSEHPCTWQREQLLQAHGDGAAPGEPLANRADILFIYSERETAGRQRERESTQGSIPQP